MATKKTGAVRGERKTGLRKRRVRVTYALTPDVIKQVKVRSAMEDIDRSEIVEEALAKYFNELK